jgi:hypothetical protein
VTDKILGGVPVETALVEAVKENFEPGGGVGYKNDDSALRKGQALIDRPNVMKGIEILFAQEGFSPQDAALTHIDHIKGIEYDKAFQTKDGIEVQRVKDKPNYQALKDYWLLTTPRAPTRLEVRSASVVEMIEKPSSPLMASRSLKKVESRESD